MQSIALRLGLFAAILLSGVLLVPSSQAGGSGFNTVVVINQNSSNSSELGNYYCERRQVPPENVLRISWPGDNIQWTAAEYQTHLLQPLLDMLAARQLTNQAHYVVLSMDIPFQTVSDTGEHNSTTSVLFYGMKSASGPAATAMTNSYAASEGMFPNDRPASAPGHSFLATMITAGSIAQARQLVDQGIASDGTFPTARVILAKSSDPLRNMRYPAFDNAIFNARLRGSFSVVRTNSDSPAGQTNLLGYQTGLASFNVSPGAFVPGAMADSMTSFGGVIFGPNGQTTLLAFINAGAAGSYGTVTEPLAAASKFPSPQNYFYQLRGFSLAECYYQSLEIPYQGLVVGEPLAAPFRRAATGRWTGILSNAVLSGTAQPGLQFLANGPEFPLQQVDLFVDGRFLRTLTNVPPSPGNRLTVNLNNHPINYTVPPGASIGSVAAGLAALLNNPANTNITKTLAAVHGDRVEICLLAANRPAGPTGLRVSDEPSSGGGTVAPFYSSLTGAAGSLTTFLIPSRDAFMNSPASGIKACSVGGPIQVGAWLQLAVTKPGGALISLAATNQSVTNTLTTLAGGLANLINASTGLQGGDGLMAEDLVSGYGGRTLFNLRARGPDLNPALKVTFTGSSNLVVTPSGQTALNDNLSDLQPRNHLHIAAGTTNLALTFALDTTTLADGHHELTAVAYEGTHVRTQTKATLPVIVQNSSLTANLTLIDLPLTAPVQGTYQIQVAANRTATVIRLFSTGGPLGAATNQSAFTFTVNGSSLGAGLHPFYALVETDTGRYRTPTQWVRLVN